MSTINLDTKHFDRLDADARRIDFLESVMDQMRAVVLSGTPYAGPLIGRRWQVEVLTEGSLGAAPTLRDAIDVARTFHAKGDITLLHSRVTDTDVLCSRCGCFQHVAVTAPPPKLVCQTCGQVFAEIKRRTT